MVHQKNCGLAIKTTPRKLYNSAHSPKDSLRNLVLMRLVRIGDRDDSTIASDNHKYCKEKHIPDRPTKLNAKGHVDQKDG